MTKQDDPLYRRWSRMVNESSNVCTEWKFVDNFITWALDNGYKKGMYVFRIDENKNYGPDNCRISTRDEWLNTRKKH